MRSVSINYLLSFYLSSLCCVRSSIQPSNPQKMNSTLSSVLPIWLLSPLHDGMNITNMEFVITQESTNKSPSVLSEFMGISKNMEDLLLVNPWNLCFIFNYLLSRIFFKSIAFIHFFSA